MEGKKYWYVEAKNFDTHWTTQTDRISFKSDDLWKFMEAYHQHKLKLLGISDIADSLPIDSSEFVEWQKSNGIDRIKGTNDYVWEDFIFDREFFLEKFMEYQNKAN